MRIVVKEARPARPTKAAASKATMDNPYVLPKGSKKTPAKPANPAAAKPANPAEPAAQQPPQAQTPTTPEQPQTQPQQPVAPQGKPEDKTKQTEKAKKKTAYLINLPFFKRLSGDPKLAGILMGATAKAEQFAGTPNYIPVMVRGLVAAGVPEAEAKKAAAEVAKQETQPQQQTQVGGQAETQPPQQPTINSKAAEQAKQAAPQWLADILGDSNPKTTQTILPEYTKLITNLFNDIMSTEKQIISFKEQKTTDAALSVPERYDNWAKQQRLINGISGIKEKTLENFSEMLSNDTDQLIPGKQVEKAEVEQPAANGQLEESKVFKKNSRGVFVLKG